ncbi:hypothetical protein GRX01_08760 [Halobaculum sp. WSA2]|uniref:Uncharacterized protein n=1 Tax=Halobaculum saliterrae TaxID=2073113 RepID=A0A6B0SRZ3_9EURY|nr:DUF5793 family protein [Halobaculum saliterrae]MXR41425.1 hypothetical protein [Halobaculum saliterrae]
MRRDHFELTVEHVDWVETDADPAKPHVYIDFQGPADLLRERLTGTDGELLDAGEIDVAYRLQSDHERDPDAAGVVGVTNRHTGDFVLELNESAEDVLQFIRAAREYGRVDEGDGRYRVEIDVDGDSLVAYEKETFLVYDAEGNLLRHESLIPSGVEL